MSQNEIYRSSLLARFTAWTAVFSLVFQLFLSSLLPFTQLAYAETASESAVQTETQVETTDEIPATESAEVQQENSSKNELSENDGLLEDETTETATESGETDIQSVLPDLTDKGTPSAQLTSSTLNSSSNLFSLMSTFATPMITTLVVSGDTAAGENQPGWLFNRDTSTATPFEFNTNQSSIGSGGLYVKPIGANPSDKFIAENFINTSVAEVNSISYDFMIGSGGDISDANEFYMNVYANFGESDDLKFYDCRYDVVPTTGSKSGFTTVTFNPNQSYPVTKRSTSPYTCPAIPAEMDNSSTGSNIRMFAISIGDTSTNDAGLDGYLDNVVVNTDSVVTTYDFEPDVTPPVCTYDFPDKKMWEVTWGYDFEHRNGGTPMFNTASNGGLISINGGAVPSYITDYDANHGVGAWHWLYVTEGQNRHYDYEFADGTVRTVDVTFSEVNGCQIPTITWDIEPLLKAEEFVATSGTYKGISVGFNASHFGTVTAVTVDVERADGSHVVKHGNQGVFDLISNQAGPVQLTAPIVIQEGSFTESSDTFYWDPAPAIWTSNTTPVSVRITVTDENGPVVVTNTTFNQGAPSWPRYLELLPDPNNQNVARFSGDVYRDIALNNCNNMTQCKDQRTKELLSGWELRLYRENLSNGAWEVVSTDTTDADGKYTFSAQQVAGIYHTCLVSQNGWTQSAQTWSGSGYLVNTPNNSGNTTETPFCTTYNFTDTSDKSIVSHLGVVDTGKPTGSATYTGGNKIGDIIYVQSIDELQYGVTLGDNYALKHTSYAVWKTDSNFTNNTKVLFCGNWNNATTSVPVSGTDDSVNGNVKDCSSSGGWTEGHYLIMHVVYDQAGNLTYFGAPYPGQKFVIDSSAPSAPVITKPTARQWFKTQPILTTWTAVTDPSGIDHYQIAYRYDDGHTFGASTCPGIQIEGKNVSGCRDVMGTSRNHTPGLSEEGGVTIWVRAVDTAGNTSPWSKSVHYFYDLTAPTGDITFPSNGTVVKSTNGKLTVNGTVNDNLSMNRVGVQLIKPGVSGHIQYLYDHMVNSNPGTWQVEFDTDTLNLSDGIYGINLYFVDMAGNVTTKQIQFTLDNTFPLFAIQNPANGDLVSGEIDVKALITDINGIKKILMTIPTKTGNKTYVYEEGKVNNSLSKSGDIYSVTIDTQNLDDGPVHVVLRATDTTGNTRYWNNNANNRQHSFIVDNTAPALTINTLSGIDTDDSVTISGTTDDSADIVVSVDGVSVGTVTPSGSTWILSIGQQAQGTHTVKVESTDAAGNTAEETTTFTVNAVQAILATQTQNNSSNSTDNNNATGGTNNSSNSNNSPTTENTEGNIQQITGGGQVLGVNDESEREEEDKDELTNEVKGESTTMLADENKDESDFNWWLLLLALIPASWWVLFGRPRRARRKIKI